MLHGILMKIKKLPAREQWNPVAWKEIEYGPFSAYERISASNDGEEIARMTWNLEQAQRRALRSLERRGLVELDRYVFRPMAEEGYFGAYIRWHFTPPDDHIPGETRIMTGVKLTTEGMMVAEAEEFALHVRRSTTPPDPEIQQLLQRLQGG